MIQDLQRKVQELQTIRHDTLVPEALVDCSQYSETEDVTHVPRTAGILYAQEIEWTEKYDTTDLVSLLATGKVRAVDLLHAFRKRATIAQQLVRIHHPFASTL